MNKADVIDILIGPFDVGAKVFLTYRPPNFKDEPVRVKGVITGLFLDRGCCVSFEVHCVENDGTGFTYYNADRGMLEMRGE